MNQLRSDYPNLKLLLTGVLLTSIVGVLLLDGQRPLLPRRTVAQPPATETCEGETTPEVVLSRETLALFLTVSERDTKPRVQEILGQPYCLLPALEVRAEVTAERAVYPLAFDPQTWLVVLYEGEEYAGYQFLFQR